MWRYINGADIYSFVNCSFDSSHLEFTVDVDLQVGYVLPNEDRDTSRSSVCVHLCIGDYMTESVLCSTGSYL